MADIRIDRLTLSLPGFAAPDAQRLVRLIAAQLAAAPQPATGSRQLDSLAVSVSGPVPTGVDQLAEQVVAEILRQVAQTLG